MSTLFICPTPIGNLEDISDRVLKTLASVDVIYCEDTRRAKKLTDNFSITTPLKSYFVGNEVNKISEIEETLKALEMKGTVDCPEYYQAQAKYDVLMDAGLEAKAKKMLRGLGYQESDFERPASEMSGGWVMRAHLARLLSMEPDLLMLDEPTNHLDLSSLLWLQGYLKVYPGAILLISHDRAFMDDLIQTVYDLSLIHISEPTRPY